MSPHPSIEHAADLETVVDARHPVRPVIWRGRSGFAKRPASLRSHERILLALAPLIRRWLGKDLPFHPVRYEKGWPVEVQRLRRLRAAGCAVPEVLHAERDLFVSSDAGPTLAQLLADQVDAGVRLQWLNEAARDLAAFHQAGHWHGGAQVRNLVRTPEGTLGRIDFETALDARFPLALLQAFDAALFFSSIVRSRESAALPDIARAYLDDAPEDARRVLRRGLPLLRRMARSKLLRKLAPKEAERLRSIAALPLDG
ncbi:MAG TPA: hypothetical protein VM406_09335 [Noviherbaspirillum sp.]|nr:hypothetical protein [Noviherbaspirillum sp.]